MIHVHVKDDETGEEYIVDVDRIVTHDYDTMTELMLVLVRDWAKMSKRRKVHGPGKVVEVMHKRWLDSGKPQREPGRDSRGEWR